LGVAVTAGVAVVERGFAVSARLMSSVVMISCSADGMGRIMSQIGG
jgi:hypothetical protein